VIRDDQKKVQSGDALSVSGTPGAVITAAVALHAHVRSSTCRIDVPR
jgi:hypothetical protein